MYKHSPEVEKDLFVMFRILNEAIILLQSCDKSIAFSGSVPQDNLDIHGNLSFIPLLFSYLKIHLWNTQRYSSCYINLGVTTP